MDVNVVTEMINNMGFPIVMVIYFIWDKTKITNQLVEAMNNNTNVMQKLLVKLNAHELAEELSEEEVV